jgi:glucosamine 6-phosphate synthetase-like amidotransferase/phosphosugar isomerase protein
MCGIVAAVAHRNFVLVLSESLCHLERRGYDSAGGAALNGSPEILCTCPGERNHVMNRMRSASKPRRPARSTIPLQLPFYLVAVLRASDVDKPGNLTQSVTVE